jgi:1-acyl-sn-glycerol-3-phosphate acyltransferase
VGLISQYIRSVLFIVLMYLWMLVLGVIGAIPAGLSRNWAYKIMKQFCAGVLWLAKVLCGITYETRGEVPTGDIVIASKHQSFLGVIFHMYLLPPAN